MSVKIWVKTSAGNAAISLEHAKQSVTDALNILRLFDTLPNFLFTTSETKRDQ